MAKKLIFLAALIFALTLTACWAGQPSQTARIPQIKFTDYRLANGLSSQ